MHGVSPVKLIEEFVTTFNLPTGLTPLSFHFGCG